MAIFCANRCKDYTLNYFNFLWRMDFWRCMYVLKCKGSKGVTILLTWTRLFGKPSPDPAESKVCCRSSTTFGLIWDARSLIAHTILFSSRNSHNWLPVFPLNMTIISASKRTIQSLLANPMFQPRPFENLKAPFTAIELSLPKEGFLF